MQIHSCKILPRYDYFCCCLLRVRDSQMSEKRKRFGSPAVLPYLCTRGIPDLEQVFPLLHFFFPIMMTINDFQVEVILCVLT